MKPTRFRALNGAAATTTGRTSYRQRMGTRAAVACRLQLLDEGELIKHEARVDQRVRLDLLALGVLGRLVEPPAEVATRRPRATLNPRLPEWSSLFRESAGSTTLREGRVIGPTGFFVTTGFWPRHTLAEDLLRAGEMVTLRPHAVGHPASLPVQPRAGRGGSSLALRRIPLRLLLRGLSDVCALPGAGGHLDAAGGTDIFQMAPARVKLIEGTDAIRCVSISKKVLRWYTECCRTPIGNTAANPRFPIVAIIHSFMDHDGHPRDDVLGRPLCRIYERSATGPLPPNAPPSPSLKVFGRRASKLLGWWVQGLNRPTPFFDDRTKAPRALPGAVAKPAGAGP
jgi:hypothetical protein